MNTLTRNANKTTQTANADKNDMKTSELIQKLIKSIVRNGDMDIEIRNAAGDYDTPMDVRVEPHGMSRNYVVVIDTDDGDPTT